MVSFKLIALDLDGTLLDSTLKIRHESMAAIAQARERGVEVIIVTGRHHVGALPYHHQLGLRTPAICCNGSYAWDYAERTAHFPNPLSISQALMLLRLIRAHEVHALMYVSDAIVYETHESHLDALLAWSAGFPAVRRPRFVQVDNFEAAAVAAETVWKFAITHREPEPLLALVAAAERELGLSCEWAGANRVDIAQRGNSKGGLLQRWAKQQGIPLDQIIAFGDNHNDISMLSSVGFGVAMSNADSEVQAAAKWVTGHHDETAIAETIERFVLGAQS